MSDADTDRGLLPALVGDGTPLLNLTALALILSGGFSIFQSTTGYFHPHDEAFLGMTASDLCGINECRIVHFMFHDRVAFGGMLLAVGMLYLWLASLPLRRGEAWAWWLFVVSGIEGFGSFLAYLGYGYLDSWHGVATLFLLPCFVLGLILSCPDGSASTLRSLVRPGVRTAWTSPFGIGRGLLLGTAFGLVCAGATIMTVGMTVVFVPQDLEFMGMGAADLDAINPRLIPLIAHDRAGFGGGVLCSGLLIFFSVWCGRPSRAMWDALLIAGVCGFGAAIGVHPAVGYNDLFHLAPAILGAAFYFGGLALCYRPMRAATVVASNNAASDLAPAG